MCTVKTENVNTFQYLLGFEMINFNVIYFAFSLLGYA